MNALVRAAGVATLALGLCGCLVSVNTVDDGAPHFARARAEAARVEGQPGQPGHVNVLVYDQSDHELVSVSAPLWLVRKVGNLALGNDPDGEGEAFARRCLTPENLAKAGRGVLLEVDEEGGDQVLIWLR
jgi:hypothetical protein